MTQKTVHIKEQVIDDPASGLTIEFKARDDGETRIYLRGSELPFGKREIHFDKDGNYAGAGTWLKE
jgi:hypothetical protein